MYTGNKRVWRAENIKWLINIVKFPQFIQHFFPLKYISKERGIIANFESICIGYVILYLKMLLRSKDWYPCIFSAIYYISMPFEGSKLQLNPPPHTHTHNLKST